MALTRFSKLKEGVCLILKEGGYIHDYRVYEEGAGHRFIEITMKYINGRPAVVGIDRVSSPGCRRYAGYDEAPRVLGGMGMSILTTPKGILRDRDARKLKVGGEILCKVW